MIAIQNEHFVKSFAIFTFLLFVSTGQCCHRSFDRNVGQNTNLLALDGQVLPSDSNSPQPGTHDGHKVRPYHYDNFENIPEFYSFQNWLANESIPVSPANNSKTFIESRGGLFKCIWKLLYPSIQYGQTLRATDITIACHDLETSRIMDFFYSAVGGKNSELGVYERKFSCDSGKSLYTYKNACPNQKNLNITSFSTVEVESNIENLFLVNIEKVYKYFTAMTTNNHLEMNNRSTTTWFRWMNRFIKKNRNWNFKKGTSCKLNTTELNLNGEENPSNLEVSYPEINQEINFIIDDDDSSLSRLKTQYTLEILLSGAIFGLVCIVILLYFGYGLKVYVMQVKYNVTDKTAPSGGKLTEISKPAADVTGVTNNPQDSLLPNVKKQNQSNTEKYQNKKNCRKSRKSRKNHVEKVKKVNDLDEISDEKSHAKNALTNLKNECKDISKNNNKIDKSRESREGLSQKFDQPTTVDVTSVKTDQAVKQSIKKKSNTVYNYENTNKGRKLRKSKGSQKKKFSQPKVDDKAPIKKETDPKIVKNSKSLKPQKNSRSALSDTNMMKKAVKQKVQNHSKSTETVSSHGIISGKAQTESDIKSNKDQITAVNIAEKSTQPDPENAKLLAAEAPANPSCDKPIQKESVSEVKSEKRPERKESVTTGMTGLQNLGSTCFLNSVIQVLSNTPKLRDFFISEKYRDDLNRESAFGTGGKLAECFERLLKTLWSGEHTCIRPSELKDIISKKAKQFSGRQQQDAQEFLTYLLDILHEDLNRIKVKPFTERVAAAGRPDKVVSGEAWQLHQLREKSFVMDIFTGQFKSSVTCMSCGNVSVAFDPFLTLPVPVPKSKKVQLENCLDGFVKTEKLGADQTVYCAICKEHKEATKQMSLSRLPEILVIQLKRFSRLEYNTSTKLNKLVRYPLRGLQLDNYLCTGMSQTGAVYDLQGIVNHYGKVNDGHYNAFAYSGTETGEWRMYNDKTVTVIDEEDVLTEHAYLLLYHLRDSHTS